MPEAADAAAGAAFPATATGHRGSEELLRKLGLTVTRRLDGILHGEYQSLFPGPGSEPGDARVYEPGDDVRMMDWSVTARTTIPHVRVPIADRELEVWVVADLSASLDFGTARCTKRELAINAVAAIGFLTARAGNRIGGIIVQGGVARGIPARPGRNHLLTLLHAVVTTASAEGAGATGLAEALVETSRVAKRRGMVVVVSDFLADGWERTLRALGSRHEVICMEVVDPRELELPDVGYVTLVDPETGEARDIHTSSARLRGRFAAAAAGQRARIEDAIRGTGADHLVLNTDRDWLVDMVRFVTGRKRRRDFRSQRPGGVSGQARSLTGTGGRIDS